VSRIVIDTSSVCLHVSFKLHMNTDDSRSEIHSFIMNINKNNVAIIVLIV
jgi:hypothetical protein